MRFQSMAVGRLTPKKISLERAKKKRYELELEDTISGGSMALADLHTTGRLTHV